jgi:sugar/nucleoside kinase (ribokinase family)
MIKNNPPRFTAIAAGLVCLDIIPGLANFDGNDFDRQFKPGQLIETEETILSTGGSVSNTGLAMHRLGIDTRLVSRIGNDSFAEILKGFYRHIDERLLETLITDPYHMTGHTFVINPKNQDRRFLYHAGANDYFCSDDVDESVLKTAGLFHFGYPPLIKTMIENDGSELVKLYKKVKNMGLTTSMDMCVPDPSRSSGQAPWKTILQQTLPFVDLFLPSFEEILYMLDKPLYERMSVSGDLIAQADDNLLSDLSQQLLDLGCRIILIKLGYRGVFLRTSTENHLSTMGIVRPSNISDWADRSLKQPSYEVIVKGTCGSGDCCIAGFLSSLLRDLSPEDALKMAAGAGACCCEKPDAFSGLMTWNEICNRIDSGWKIKTE